MAINYATILIRRGPKDDLQIDKLLPGELAMATDAPVMWFCWSPGEVEQIPTNENIGEVIEEITKKYLSEYAKKTDIPTKTSQLQNDSNFLTEHQDLSGYAKKATSLAGYGIADGATKEEFNQLSHEITDVKGDLGNVKNDIYQISHGYEKVTDGLTEINGYGITKVSDTSFTIEKSPNDSNLIGYPVKAGDKVKITGKVFPVYNALGYVLATTTDVPSEWSGGNSLPMLSATENDYFCGNNEQVWKSYECELTIPNGAKMIWIRGINPSISIYKEFYEPNVYTKEETDSKINSLKGNINKDIYTIDTLPTVTTGTITKQHKHSRQDRDAYLWSLSETGTLTMENIKVDADKNDVVGLWVYVNAVQLTYANNTDGVFKIYIDGIKTKEISCAYDLLLGWNYVPLGITDSNPHTVEIIYTLVRGEYLFGIDTIELNYRTRPKVLLSFDMANWSGGNIYTDNRYEILSKYGFTATFCNPHDFPSSDLNALLKEGWDWSIYGGQGTRPNYDTGSIEEWCAYLQTNIDLCASVGLFNPISYFSPANRMSVVLEQALKKVGFKVSRIAGTTTNIKWFDDKDGLYISTVAIGGTVTAEEIIEKLDDAINSGSCICLFTHAVQDELTDNMNCTKEVYETIISALRNRVDNGLCDVVTFREFYQHWCPEGYAELMENRHEKEKQYILSKLSN